MKKMMTILALILLSANLFAQDKTEESNLQGIIQYEEVIQLNIQINEEASAIAHLLPKESRSNKVLHFTNESSLYQSAKKEETDMEEVMDNGEGIVKLKMEEPEYIIYTDIVKKEQIEQREFMMRTFLIKNKIEDSFVK